MSKVEPNELQEFYNMWADQLQINESHDLRSDSLVPLWTEIIKLTIKDSQEMTSLINLNIESGSWDNQGHTQELEACNNRHSIDLELVIINRLSPSSQKVHCNLNKDVHQHNHESNNVWKNSYHILSINPFRTVCWFTNKLTLDWKLEIWCVIRSFLIEHGKTEAMELSVSFVQRSFEISVSLNFINFVVRVAIQIRYLLKVNSNFFLNQNDYLKDK